MQESTYPGPRLGPLGARLALTGENKTGPFLPPSRLPFFFSFMEGEKKTPNKQKPNLAIYFVVFPLLNCLASDFANFLDVHFWFCTKEPHFLLESGPGDRPQQALEIVSTPQASSSDALTLAVRLSCLPCPSLPVHLLWGSTTNPSFSTALTARRGVSGEGEGESSATAVTPVFILRLRKMAKVNEASWFISGQTVSPYGIYLIK